MTFYIVSIEPLTDIVSDGLYGMIGRIRILVCDCGNPREIAV